MPDHFEIRINGRIGPVIRSCLPELTVVAAAESTLLIGGAVDPDDLRHLLDLLDGRGLAVEDVRLAPPAHRYHRTSRDPRTEIGTTPVLHYEIRVTGRIPADLLEQIEDVHATLQPVETVLRGAVDQAELHDIISRLQGLGLELTEARRI